MLDLLLNTQVFPMLAIFLFSLALTKIVRQISRRVGFVSKPAADRWSRRTVSLGGGIAIQLSILVGILWAQGELLVGVLPAFLALFVLGLIDDIWGTSASAKLIVQAMAASWVVGHGFLLPIPWAVPAIALTIIWIVGVTNALNLIDNMDGLAAGATVIAGLGLTYLLHSQGAHPALISLAAVITGASAGFLVYNFHPARIFMGDAGSLPIGFILAILSLKLRFPGNEIPEFFSFIPICLVLLVPLFDTSLVMVARRNASRPLMSGGRDHTSHRLVELGLSERSAVLVLYLFGVIGFLSALILLRSSLTEFIPLSIGIVIGITLFGVFLLEIAVYPLNSKENILPHIQSSLPMPILYMVELALDICAVSLAWTAAHAIRFHDQGLETFEVLSVVPILPYLITAKLIAFSSFRIYRGLWRTITTRDVYSLFKAATLGSLLLVCGLAIFTRLKDLSRMVIIIDWLLTFVLVLGMRAALSAFRRWFRRLASSPSKAALLGDLGLLEMVRQATAEEKGIEFSGVITPTEGTEGNDVLGNAKDLESIVLEKNIHTLLVATHQFDDTVNYLAAKGIIVRYIKIHLT